jgi:hypothetical protein
MKKNELILVSSLVAIGIASRLIFNELKLYNFNAVTASAMFAGAFIASKGMRFAIPLVTMFLTDAVLGFYYAPSLAINYGALLVAVLAGTVYAKKPSLLNYFIAFLASSVSFFIITNFGAWLFQTVEPQIYAHTFEGLMQAYAAAIPFYQNSVVSNLLFSAAMFGSFEMAKVYLPKEKAVVA